MKTNSKLNGRKHCRFNDVLFIGDSYEYKMKHNQVYYRYRK